MSEIYRRDLREALQAAAREEGIPLREGVYLQLTGPAYETPAEIRMCRILGADAVGMSTACEAMAANHCGFRVCGAFPALPIWPAESRISPCPTRRCRRRQTRRRAYPAASDGGNSENVRKKQNENRMNRED